MKFISAYFLYTHLQLQPFTKHTNKVITNGIKIAKPKSAIGLLNASAFCN